MSTTTISLNVPPLRLAPPAAVRLGEWFAAALAALIPAGRPATPRYPSRQAARVRAMAHQYELSDPRFASELFAAADRHEMLYGD
jgi:hypothetical protein